MRRIGNEFGWAGGRRAILGIAIADTAVIEGRWPRYRHSVRPADGRRIGLRALHAVWIGAANRAVVGVVVARQVLGDLQRRTCPCNFSLHRLADDAAQGERDEDKHASVHGEPLDVSQNRVFDSTLRSGFGFVNKNLRQDVTRR